MATTQLGQFRYTGSGCMAEISSKAQYKSVSVDVSVAEDTTSFQDVAIVPNAAFTKGQDYYLRVQIPQDMNYAMEFTIKLIKGSEDGNETYQYLKTVNVNAGGDGKNVHTVVLYEKSNGIVAAMIPLTYGTSNIKDNIYYKKENDKYYLGTGGSTYTQTDKFNEVSIIASWKVETGDRYGIFEMVFRPVEDSFTSIVLQMTRQPEDYNIQRTNGSNTEYGRKLDLSKLKYSLYQVTNLVTMMNNNASLDRIGVWGHSGLMMSVNGEEIKIGPSGFYELSEVPVTSLGIIAPDNSYQDSFTIDYEFTQKEEGE